MNKNLVGGLLITLAMFIFSLIGPFVRTITLPPLVIIFHTSLITALIILGVFACQKKLKLLVIKDHRLWMVTSALLILGNVFCFYKAYASTSMANAVLTHYTAPIFAAAFAPVVLKERLERITVLALLISMTGLVLIAYDGISISNRQLAGIIFGAVSGLFYGMSILVSKKLVQFFPPYVILFCQSLVAVLVLLPFLGVEPYTLSPKSLALLTGYALLVCLLGVFLFLKGLKGVEAQRAGILAYSEPVLVVLIGVLFYNEVPTLKTFLGGAFILVSGALILKAEAGRKD